MTKRELARKQAEHMNSINPNVNIERMTEVLATKMTKHELEVVNGLNK